MDEDGTVIHPSLQNADNAFGQGDYKQAIFLYRRFLGEWAADPKRVLSDVVHVWVWMGTCHMSLGEEQNALSCFSSAVRVTKAVFGEFSQPYAMTVSKQAIALADAGQMDEGLKLALKAADIIGKLCGKKSSEYGECLYTLGRIYLDKKDMIEAKLFFLESRTLLAKVDHKYAVLLSDLALVHEGLEEMPSALAIRKQVLQLQQEFLGAEHPQTALAMTNLAFLHYRMNDFHKARLLYEKALAVQTAYFGPDHVYTQEAGEGLLTAKAMIEADVLLMSEEHVCAMCAYVSPKLQNCSKCKLVYYCDAECQKVRAIHLRDNGYCVDFPLFLN